MTPGERRNLLRGLGFTSLWIVGLAVFTAYPVVASLYYSFCDYSILKSPVWSGLENYRLLAEDDLFWKSLGNTLFFAALSVPLGTVVASAMLWIWILNGQYGLLNYALAPLLRPFGVTPPVWLLDPAWAKPALVLMSLWGTGNAMVIYLAGLQDVPKELYEAASIDGAGAWRRFWHVTLPMLAPVIYFNVTMATIGALQVFAQAWVVSVATGAEGADGSPARSTLLYTVYLFSTAFHNLRMGYASAMAYVLFLIIASLTWIGTRLSRDRVERGL